MQIPKDLIKEAEKKLQSVKNKSEFYNLRSWQKIICPKCIQGA